MTLRTHDFALGRLGLAALLFVSASAAAAETRPRPDPDAATAAVIAIPPLATAENAETDAGSTWTLANQIAALISTDLETSNNFIIADVKGVRIPSYPEVTAPSYSQWRKVGAKLLLSGFVNARSDGRLTIGCYIYDVQSGQELARQGFAVPTGEWRRAAHKCADAAYVEATGRAPVFDSRIAYVAQSGSADSPVKRLAVMDFDGANHVYLTDGDSTVITPRWSPSADRIAYTSFANERLQVRVADVSSKADRPLLPLGDDNFAPTFAPDGRTIALSMSVGGNTDVYAVDANGGYPRRLTTAPAIDTGASYSPDGERIAFVSDRSGSPQLYVMNSDGSNQRRISFGGGEYGSPVWSPDGEHIAFTRIAGPAMRIGVMNTNGSDEKIISYGSSDQQPTWSPDGARILFQQLNPATHRTALAMVPVSGGQARTVLTPQGATDPAWGERQGQAR
ncbi:MAG TPA: Tol-Pal system beta propeller repeat protein TolB [Sphingomicrobium sp.]|nr:Tol-Pal system beta propeller repeat protein TolB [Sphingomicrobium sp.]